MNGEKMSSTHEILIRDNMTKMAHIEMHARREDKEKKIEAKDNFGWKDYFYLVLTPQIPVWRRGELSLQGTHCPTRRLATLASLYL